MTIVHLRNQLASLPASYAIPAAANSGLVNMCFPNVKDVEYVAYNNTLNRRVDLISSERNPNPSPYLSSIATLLPLITSGKASQGPAISIPKAPDAPASLERGSREKYNADAASDKAFDEEVSKTLFGPEAASLTKPIDARKQEKNPDFKVLAFLSLILLQVLFGDGRLRHFAPVLVD